MSHAVDFHPFRRKQIKRGGVVGLEARCEVREEIARLVEGVALPHAVKRDDGHALGDGSEELEETPRSREHLLGLEEHEHVRVLDVVEQSSEIAEVVRVCRTFETKDEGRV